LADGLVDLPGVTALDPARVRTNFVFFELTRADLRGAFLDALAQEGVLMIEYPHSRRIRAVTHYGIDAADIDASIAAARKALAAIGLAPAAVAVGQPA
jgi:threonine aldolase